MSQNDHADSSEGVFISPPHRVAALLDLGTSDDGELTQAGETEGGSRRDPGERTPDVPGYEISGKLGEGGMGTVWRAVQLSTRRAVALKLVGHGVVGSRRARVRFDREVELAAKLEHPHVARIYDSGMTPGAYYFAMELVEGRHLDQHVREEGLNARQVLSLMRDVCLAVQHAHQRGVIHRDLKPANVMVTRDGTPKVLDFGLAKALGEATSTELCVSLEGQLSGTPAYMSPEQASGRLDGVDTRTDVYSLGIILYRLLTGHPPHDLSGSRLEVLRRIHESDVRRPRDAGKSIDAEQEVVLLKALAREPERRYASAAELANDIDNYLAGRPIAARRPTTGYVLRKLVQRHRLPLAAVVAVALTLVGTGGFFYAREVEQRRVAQDHQRGAERSAAQERAAKDLALSERRRAELALADARMAEGDALVAADHIGDAKLRYADAIDTLRRNGGSTVMADAALWEAHRRSPPPMLELRAHGMPVTCATFLPDGRRILTADEGGHVRVFDALTGHLLRRIEVGSRVVGCSIAPGGRVVAVAGFVNGVTCWDLDTGQPVGPPLASRGRAISVAYSPDGKYLLVGTDHADDNLSLFDATTGRPERALRGNIRAVRAVAFSPDGRRVWSASGNGPTERYSVTGDFAVRAWDVATGRQLWVQGTQARESLPTGLALAPDAATVVAPSSAKAGHWEVTNAATGTPLGVLPLVGCQAAAFSPGGLLIGAASSGGVVEVYHADTRGPVAGQHARTLFFGGERAVSFSPDGRFVMAAAGTVVRVWPLVELAAHRSLWTGRFLNTHGHFLHAVSISPDGRFALGVTKGDPLTGEKGRLTLWDVATGSLLTQADTSVTPRGVEERGFSAARAALLPNGRSVLRVDGDGQVGVYNLSLQRRERALKGPDGLSAAAVSVSDDGQHAMVQYWAKDQLHLYDLPTGRWRCQLPTGRDNAHTLAFTSDSRFAIAACDYRGTTATVWDVATGRELRSLSLGDVGTFALAPDGKLLAAGFLSGVMRLIDPLTGFEQPAKTWPARVRAAAYMPDERYAVVAGQFPVSLWDMETGRTRSLGETGASWYGVAAHAVGPSQLLLAG